jgi:ribosomal protein S18 acetylase RimI-like enzyme
MHICTIPPGVERDEYLPLLRLADDSEDQVRSYYQTGELYAWRNEDEHTLGVVLVSRHASNEAELKAVAVDSTFQGRGYGLEMVRAVVAELRNTGIRRVIVGTANCSIGQLAFYQKVEFRLLSIERDFFTPERGYSSGITENGIPLRDMVWMDQEL